MRTYHEALELLFFKARARRSTAPKSHLNPGPALLLFDAEVCPVAISMGLAKISVERERTIH